MPIHSQRLVYAFREGNTFMHDLAAVEPPEGFQKHVITVPATSSKQTREPHLRRAIRAAGLTLADMRHIDTQVITDLTLEPVVKKFARGPPVPSSEGMFGRSQNISNAYKALEEVTDPEREVAHTANVAHSILRQLDAVVQDIRSQNKEPLLVDFCIGDHHGYGLEFSGKEDHEKVISEFLGQRFKAKVISFEDVLKMAAKNRSVDDKILLMDHHALSALGRQLKDKTRLFQVASTCPCHLYSTERSKDEGFRPFETEREEDRSIVPEVHDLLMGFVGNNVKRNAWIKENPAEFRKRVREARKRALAGTD